MKIHVEDTIAFVCALFLLFGTMLEPMASLAVAVVLVAVLGVIENRALKSRLH